jgi:hypothetical protein
MAFDWEAFLRARRIEYVTAGHSKGNIGIKCVFCGDADHGFHLGIHLQGKGWFCWRNRSHRGVRPHRLIQALIGCSYFEAQRIVGDGPNVSMLSDESFGQHIKALVAGQLDERKGPKPLQWPKEIHRLGNAGGRAPFFTDYLFKDPPEGRGYEKSEINDICQWYDLHYAMRGDYAYRVIFPVEMFEGLVTWTGRSISKNAPLRYRTLTANPERQNPDYPLALRSIKDCLWNLPDLVNDPKRILLVCEGPFDAMRLDYYGHELGIRATCLFSKSVTDAQLYELEDIAPIFEERILLLDPDASLDLLPTMERLQFLRFKPLRLPARFEDPAVLSRRDVRELFG